MKSFNPYCLVQHFSPITAKETLAYDKFNPRKLIHECAVLVKTRAVL